MLIPVLLARLHNGRQLGRLFMVQPNVPSHLIQFVETVSSPTNHALVFALRCIKAFHDQFDLLNIANHQSTSKHSKCKNVKTSIFDKTPR